MAALGGDYTAHMVEESETPESEQADAQSESPAAQAPPTVDVGAGETPSVDELQGRLADLQGAMDQLQSGDLDGAEATIAALEEAMATSKAPE